MTKISTSCSSYNIAKLEWNNNTKELLPKVHGAKAMVTQKPTAQSLIIVTNAEAHTILRAVRNLKTLHPHASSATGDTLQTTKAALSTVT
jgi:hypothetical protein